MTTLSVVTGDIVEVGQMDPARLDELIATVVALEAAQDGGR